MLWLPAALPALSLPLVAPFEKQPMANRGLTPCSANCRLNSVFFLHGLPGSCSCLYTNPLSGEPLSFPTAVPLRLQNPQFRCEQNQNPFSWPLAICISQKLPYRASNRFCLWEEDPPPRPLWFALNFYFITKHLFPLQVTQAPLPQFLLLKPSREEEPLSAFFRYVPT